MRTVTFGGACSLDLFIARTDDAMDWLHWSDDVTTIMGEYWKTIDTVVMGRKTYEVALKNGSGGGSYPGMATYVCSRTMTEAVEGVSVVNDATQLIRELTEQPGKDICVMGGGELGQSLLQAGLIDEIGLNVHPVLLGSGIPLFPGQGRQFDLELKECRAIDGGCVYVTYRVKK